MLISLQMTAHFVFSAAVLPLWLHPTVANDDDGLAAAAAAHRRCSTGALLLCLPTAAAAADSLHRQSIATASAVIAQSIDHPLSYLISLNAREMALTLRCALICRSGRTALSLSLHSFTWLHLAYSILDVVHFQSLKVCIDAFWQAFRKDSE